MEARATFRGPSVSRALVAGALVVIALGTGAAGGYVAASVGRGNVAAPAAKTISDQSQGGPLSDLTRALPMPAPAVLPDWILREITPNTAPAQRIRQDDPNFITMPDQSQGGPQSDLTRALPAVASDGPWSRSR